MNKVLTQTNIREQLPHGAIKEIAKKAKTSYYTANRILKGERRSPKTAEVLQVTANYIIAHKAKEKEAIEAVNSALMQ